MIRWTLRQRILGAVGCLVMLTLLGSSMTLYRLTEIKKTLDTVNSVTVPLGKVLVQLQSDSGIYQRELERRLGGSHWSNPKFKARAVPKWIEDVIVEEVARIQRIGAPGWQHWNQTLSERFKELTETTTQLIGLLDQRQFQEAIRFYPRLTEALERWNHHLQLGLQNSDQAMQLTFGQTENQVSQLRTGLQIVLGVVVALSLLLLWLGERALRPLSEITRVASNIARRGLRKEDHAQIPETPLGRADEISELTREFQKMATTLLERDQEVETQSQRLIETNRMLSEMGELNRNVIDRMDSILIVVDHEGLITRCNPRALEWLEQSEDQVLGSRLIDSSSARLLCDDLSYVTRAQSGRRTLKSRTLGYQVLPLGGGAIWIIDDLTEQLALEGRLVHAEKLAAVGQMSAQVAHEIRNPLHSIGLEAEIAIDVAARVGNPALKQSLQSIQTSVDRLEKITENYLKLSRLSGGEKQTFDFGDALESMLATYAPSCEAQGVQVDWSRPPGKILRVKGDRDLIEHVIGNLFKNSLQAGAGRISWRLGSAESGRIWARIEDDGPGIPEEIRPRLFTPFATSRAQGTGLGLSFVKRVLEDHGGEIRCIESQSGQGACFELYLPQVPPEFRSSSQEKRV